MQKKTFRTAGPKHGHNEYLQIYWIAKPQVWVGSLHRPLEPAESPLQTVQWPRINLVFGAGARGSALHPWRESWIRLWDAEANWAQTVASAPLKEGIKTWCRCHCCTRARPCSTSGLSITMHQDRNAGQKLNKQKTWQQENFESQKIECGFNQAKPWSHVCRTDLCSYFCFSLSEEKSLLQVLNWLSVFPFPPAHSISPV